MISLFTKYKISPLNLVTLPSYCVTTKESKESSSLVAKRDAQLKWMREKGMTYLGDPLKQIDLKKIDRKHPRLSITPVRLVSVRKDGVGAGTTPDLAREA